MIYMNMINRFLFSFLPLLFFVFSFSVQAGMDMNNLSGLALKKIKENSLTTLKSECLSFEYQKENERYVFFSVRENNAPAICGGDADVSIKLFDMKYEKKNGYFFIEDDMNPGFYQRLN